LSRFKTAGSLKKIEAAAYSGLPVAARQSRNGSAASSSRKSHPHDAGNGTHKLENCSKRRPTAMPLNFLAPRHCALVEPCPRKDAGMILSEFGTSANLL